MSLNNREAGDLRRRRAHYDVTVMWLIKIIGTVCFTWVAQKLLFVLHFISNLHIPGIERRGQLELLHNKNVVLVMHFQKWILISLGPNLCQILMLLLYIVFMPAIVIFNLTACFGNMPLFHLFLEMYQVVNFLFACGHAVAIMHCIKMHLIPLTLIMLNFYLSTNSYKQVLTWCPHCPTKAIFIGQ